MFQQKVGKTTGWASYTLSWNNRQFDEINGGAVFPFKYDRRHDFSISFNHQFKEWFNISSNWVYSTGIPVTIPNYRYSASPPSFTTSSITNESFAFFFDIYGHTEKNSRRLSDYHRLDLNLVFTKHKKRLTQKWNIGAYNMYNRNNPYFVLADIDTTFADNGSISDVKRTFKEVSIFTIIPSISYELKF